MKRDVPQCKPDGSFDDIQCSVATGECWCVYYNNVEVLGTKTQGKPSCSQTGKIAMVIRKADPPQVGLM